jgi:glycosyltransferase involved in cell wall biosynthesis
MRKICLLADASSIHTARWCNHFAGKGYEMHVISFKEAKIKSATVHFLDSGSISAAGGNWKVLFKRNKVKKIIKQVNPDVLHALYATSYGMVGALTGFKPYIVTALGSDVLISGRQSKLYRRMLKYVFRKANYVTCMAEHMEKEILLMGISHEKLSVIRFGIDPTLFNDKSRLITPNEFLITSTRNFEPIYNHELLFSAMEMVKDKIKNVKLVMVGDGSQREYLKKRCIEKGLEQITIFTGKITQPEIAALLNKTNVFITVSLSDGNCISLNEAMACGAWCIAGDIEATRPWITNGVNGFLVPVDKPAELAEKIMESYTNYATLVENAQPINKKLIAEKAIWDVNMEQMDAIYKKFIK